MTEHERAQRLEIEASNLRLVKSMAEHLAHEIGNSLVPLSTHQQLLKESIGDPEFQESLSDGPRLGRETHLPALQPDGLSRARMAGRLPRLRARSPTSSSKPSTRRTPFIRARSSRNFSFNKDISPWKVTGDHKALRHAFSEIILNALQANPEDPNVAVNLSENARRQAPNLQVEVRDSGAGFNIETAQRAPEPFFSTRNVGLGLGLDRLAQDHREPSWQN